MAQPVDFASLVSKQKLQTAVSKAIGENSVEVDTYHVSKATDEMEGFLSIMLRVKVNFIYKGDRFSKLVMIKQIPFVPMQLEMVQVLKAFEKEILVIKNPIEEYKKLAETDGCSLPFPKYYFTDADEVNDTLIMEDLKDSGFKLGDKINGLDLDHCLLAMQELGKIHALSVILESKLKAPLLEVYSFLDEALFKTSDESKDSPFMAFLNSALDAVILCAETVPRLQCFVPALRKRFNGLWDEVCELVKPSNDHVNVVCHGDFHVNNMMFRYEKVGDKEKPVEVKFVDFQLARYAPPATDIVYFLYTSTVPEFRKQHMNSVLEMYYKSFISTFLKAGVDTPRFSYEDLVDSFNKTKPFGAMMLCWLRLVIYSGEVEPLPKDYSDVDPELVEEVFKGNYSDKIKRLFLQHESFRNKTIGIIDDCLELFELK